MAGTVHPILSVCPSRALSNEKFRVVVENLPPGLPVTLHSLHYSVDKEYWEAFGHYVADNTGNVDVSEDASLGGTYTGKEGMGLLWSMKSVPEKHNILRADVCMPTEVLISVYKGHQAQGFRQQPPLASVVAERWFMAPGVKRIQVREKELFASLFIPPGPGPFPGVLELWGLTASVVESRAALLASHGFVVLAVKYVLLQNPVTLDYFVRAFQFLQEHPLVITNRVGIYGMSFGAMAVLNMACHTKVISPRCCVAINGFHLLLDTTISKMLKEVFQKYGHMMQQDEQNYVTMRALTKPRLTDRNINVENLKCPLLLVVGEDDQNFASAECADLVAKMMHDAGKEHLVTTLRYPATGHMINVPYTPHNRASMFAIQFIDMNVKSLWGGHAKPSAYAQEDCWDKSLAFLREHLHPGPHSVPDALL